MLYHKVTGVSQPGKPYLSSLPALQPTTRLTLVRLLRAHRLPGGSAANVLKGLASISGGTLRSQFMGMVGRDEAAAFFTEQMQEHGVEPLLLVRGGRGEEKGKEKGREEVGRWGGRGRGTALGFMDGGAGW